MTLDTFTIEHEGTEYTVNVEPDPDMGPPWEEFDGHGPVYSLQYFTDEPGYMLLNPMDPRGPLSHYYDFKKAVEIAKKDQWGWLPGPLVIERDEDNPMGITGGRATCDEAGVSFYDPVNFNAAIRQVYAYWRGTMSEDDYAKHAAMKDFERLKAWCDDEWHYVSIDVETACCTCGQGRYVGVSLGGLESDDEEGIREAAQEIIEDAQI